ncbi:hypothetical protein CC1G_08087 [Coprinopsis cinerea okayama7|uniref:Uncharacterized protein n=1 Tax=Coprinopsis cinerea (strain Okayama-7 / 130 / ATCC MYA-4618 / FGSC 9003) TaxID=240176 RepID=A8NVF6_COPC7|nr:hypothetical protein CC1G_08087 [Coprinopsis cinerea okayama7\|eukprot:XP_001836702.2 hypothetical protein CC1G_08087 [Coprinopsis cinerea okayama7\
MVRFKNRWLLVEFIPIPTTASGGAPTSRTTLGQLPNNSAQLPPLDGKQIWTALKQSILTNFGDFVCFGRWGAWCFLLDLVLPPVLLPYPTNDVHSLACSPLPPPGRLCPASSFLLRFRIHSSTLRNALAPLITAGPPVKYFSPTTNTAIIRVAREHHKIAWAGLTLLSTIGGVRSTAGGRGGTGDGVRYIPNVVHLSAGYQDSYDAFLEKTMLEIQALQD